MHRLFPSKYIIHYKNTKKDPPIHKHINTITIMASDTTYPKTFIALGQSRLPHPSIDKSHSLIPNHPENNPAVFSHLIHHLGVSSTLGFHDVYSLSSPSLLALIPRPAYALIFICPAAVYLRAREAENDGKKATKMFHGTINQSSIINHQSSIINHQSLPRPPCAQIPRLA